MFKESGSRAVPQRAGAEETRRHILDTALALFRKRGFESTTLREIASDAGMSLGAAYYYFESKEAIVAAYYDFVQEEHQRRAREAFATSRRLSDRLLAALHTKIDIMEHDRGLIRALFRYGGDPDHALSWFGPATREQRERSMAVFADALAEEKLPPDARDMGPLLLWTLHMGLLLYFQFDNSPQQRKTRALTDASVKFIVDIKRLALSPLLKPMRKRIAAILRDAGLLEEAA